MSGSILAWDKSPWMLTNVLNGTVDGFCKRPPGLTLYMFPKPRTWAQALRLCSPFGKSQPIVQH